MTTFEYLAFGLRIESTRAIPSLMLAEGPFVEAPDVQIIEGSVTLPEDRRDIDGVEVHVGSDDCILSIHGCGRFQIIGARQIIVDPHPAATADQVNLYLLGSVFGVLLHQRRMFPFHCNGVEVEGAAVLFCGASGAGKSTLAAHFAHRGYKLLSDDLCALRFDSDGRLIAFPGVARLKLCADALEEFGRSSSGLSLVPWYDDKFEVPLKGENWDKELPVAGIYQLRIAANGDPTRIHRLKGLDAANCITSNIYRRRLADLTGAAPLYLASTSRIIEQIPVLAMDRRWGFAHFYEDASNAEDHMRNLVAGSARPRSTEATSTRSERAARG